MKSPALNPLRFWDSTRMPNWTSRFPNIDNTTQRVEYISGLNPVQYYKEFLYNQAMYLQFEKEAGDDLTLTIKKYNTSTYTYDTVGTIAAVDITPSGWVGNSHYSYTYTFTEGTYYLTFPDGFRSDTFAVISDSDLIKKLVEVRYRNNENDFSCIFDNDFEFVNYFQGQLVPAQDSGEIESYKTDRQEDVKLQSSIQDNYELNINDIHITYKKHITSIFALDEITVNGLPLENTEIPTYDFKEKTDIMNAVVKLSLVDNDYNYVKT